MVYVEYIEESHQFWSHEAFPYQETLIRSYLLIPTCFTKPLLSFDDYFRNIEQMNILYTQNCFVSGTILRVGLRLRSTIDFPAVKKEH